MSLNLSYQITKKAVQPEWLPIADAKDQIRVRHSYEDDYIGDCISAAVDEAENYLSSFLDHRDVVIVMNDFPKDLAIEYGPVLGGEFSVSYYSNDAELELEDAYVIVQNYGEKPKFSLNPMISLPGIDSRIDAVKFTYVAGADEIEPSVKKALQLIVAEMYEFRTDRNEIMSTRAKALMRGHKVWD